ncbi:hypothetical protein [Gordonia westfalica]|uniref:Uncharacterized protein n=1 Tax=Gordonia westfalica TaxID=158898 RepID=A0A1H2DQL7_9ACTN|nr:hypothetical protein [Gordonia westfalica]SDT85180.1 hypothetical protein SAMN04488548_11612 [Gordonia westfalica]
MSRHRRGIPAVFDVEHLPFNGTGADDYGNDVESWGEPDPRKFVTFIDPQSDELDLPGHIRDSVDVESSSSPISVRCHHVTGKSSTELSMTLSANQGLHQDSVSHGGGCYVVTLKVVKSS